MCVRGVNTDRKSRQKCTFHWNGIAYRVTHTMSVCIVCKTNVKKGKTSGVFWRERKAERKQT